MAQINMPQKRDPLQTILAGVQIAGGILGIKESMEKSDLTKLQIKKAEDEQKRQEEGRLLPTEAFALKSKANIVPEGTPGAVAFRLPGEDKPTYFTPKPEGMSAYETAQIDLKRKQLEIDAANNADMIAKDKSKTKFDREGALRDDYTKLSQRTSEAILGFKKVQQAGQNYTDNGYDDVALLYGFMKTIDPGAAVQEGDKAIFEKTTSIPNYIVNLYNNAVDGTKLKPEQRLQVVQSAAKQVKAYLDQQNQTDNLYEMYAKNANVDSKNVVNNYYKSFEDDLKQYLNPKKEKQNQIGFGEAGAAPKKPAAQVLDEFNALTP